MSAPRLIALTSHDAYSASLHLERLGALCAAARPGSVLVQLRDKELSARARLALGGALRRLCRATGQLFAVNDRLDLALLLDADAVHLGEASLSPAQARRLVPRALLSVASHDPHAEAPAGADAVVLSPCFARRKGRPPLGVAGLRAARAQLPAHVGLYALGGADASTAALACAAGATGVAAIGGVLEASSPLPLLRALGIAR